MPRLLYVEDDELLQMVTTIALEDAGFEVIQASDGQSARELLAAHAGFDYVVSDISMPGGVTGVDVAQAALQARPSCRTVLISGYALAQLPALPDNTRFLEKPYHVRDLLAALGN